MDKNLIVVLGPTASGKTRLGVQIAASIGGEVISADSRQVYRGLNIGAGKDLNEYSAVGKPVPYHLIDCADLSEEYNTFRFQQDFYAVFKECQQRGRMPVLTGGTGLYLESVLLAYSMVAVAENSEFRRELEMRTDQELAAMLEKAGRPLHNTTDLVTRERLIRALEIARAGSETPMIKPKLKPLVLGIRWERSELRKRIELRLAERLNAGMLAEVAGLQKNGVSWERLHSLGLEYRFCSDYLLGKITTLEQLRELLGQAICKFAKRQETWFRRMEKRGVVIQWIDRGDWNQAHERLIAGGFRML